MNPTTTAEIDIDLRPEVLGVSEFTPALIDRIAEHADHPEGTLRETVAALIDIHRGSNDDKRQLKEKYGRMGIELRATCRGLALGCCGVPVDSLLHGTIPVRQQRQISQAVRDLVLPPTPPEGVEDASAALSAHVKRFVARTPLLAQAPRPRAFIWGGHSIGREEYDFAKECGYWDALGNGTEFITGCGPGVMKAPFKGAVIAYGKQDFAERRIHRDFIGFTERGIIAAEAPNAIVSELVIFPDVEKRMEAFIRGAHRGRIHPGGAGTLEELLTFLGIKSHPNNRDLQYPLDLVERPDGGYMKRIIGWLHHCFGDTLDGLYHLHLGEPRRYAEHVHESNRDLDITRLWNDEIYVPAEMQRPFARASRAWRGSTSPAPKSRSSCWSTYAGSSPRWSIWR